MEVRSVKDGTYDKNNVKHFYCGRRTRRDYTYFGLGNPHVVTSHGEECPQCHLEHSLGQAIEAFRTDLFGGSLPSHARLIALLPEDAILYCWCRPRACHCDIIIDYWNHVHVKPPSPPV